MHRKFQSAPLVAAAISIAGIAGAAIAQVNRDVMRILQEPEIRERFLAQGAEPALGTPEKFLTLRKEEYVS